MSTVCDKCGSAAISTAMYPVMTAPQEGQTLPKRARKCLQCGAPVLEESNE